MVLPALILTCLVAATPASGPDRRVDFDREVRPLLSQHCLACHGPSKQKGGLRLDLSRRAPALEGGKTGAAIVPGNVEESLLVEKIEAGEMPPKSRLAPPQVEAVRAWIAAGAPYLREPVTTPRAGPDWWSLQPIRPTPVPTLSGPDAQWARTPIDAFILARLKERGLSPAPEADRAHADPPPEF